VSQSTIQLCPIEEDDGSKEKTETKKKEVYWAGVEGVSSGEAS